MTITAPSGNTFASNTLITSAAFNDLNALCCLVEKVAFFNAEGAPGYSNTEILNYFSALTYTGANNYGNSTVNVGGRAGFANSKWQGNLTIQMVVNTFQTVVAANS